MVGIRNKRVESEIHSARGKDIVCGSAIRRVFIHVEGVVGMQLCDNYVGFRLPKRAE